MGILSKILDDVAVEILDNRDQLTVKHEIIYREDLYTILAATLRVLRDKVAEVEAD